ncbi:hypothetical protein Hte_010365 [Hypoxylon texense]
MAKGSRSSLPSQEQPRHGVPSTKHLDRLMSLKYMESTSEVISNKEETDYASDPNNPNFEAPESENDGQDMDGAIRKGSRIEADQSFLGGETTLPGDIDEEIPAIMPRRLSSQISSQIGSKVVSTSFNGNPIEGRAADSDSSLRRPESVGGASPVRQTRSRASNFLKPPNRPFTRITYYKVFDIYFTPPSSAGPPHKAQSNIAIMCENRRNFFRTRFNMLESLMG